MVVKRKAARVMAGRESARVKEARARARQVKAEVDAERVEREQKIEAALEGFYVARAAREDALVLADEHRVGMADQVEILLGLGEPMEQVARLCGVAEADVKALRRVARSQHRGDVAELARGPVEAPEVRQIAS